MGLPVFDIFQQQHNCRLITKDIGQAITVMRGSGIDNSCTNMHVNSTALKKDINSWQNGFR